MVQILTKEDFVLVPWKNGRGVTRELIRISKTSEEEFDFRLSIAKVDQNSSFSLYKGHERILVLLDGEGLKLKGPSSVVTMDKVLDYYSFRGEESIDCELLGSACVDFNAITNRNYGHSEIEIEINLPKEEIYRNIRKVIAFDRMGYSSVITHFLI